MLAITQTIAKNSDTHCLKQSLKQAIFALANNQFYNPKEDLSTFSVELTLLNNLPEYIEKLTLVGSQAQSLQCSLWNKNNKKIFGRLSSRAFPFSQVFGRNHPPMIFGQLYYYENKKPFSPETLL